MTTSEPGKGERRPAKETKYELPWLGPGASAEFLDIASLTRLANEFMRALPDSSDKALANTVDTTTLKGQLATSNQHIPSEAELRQLPFTLSGSAAHLPTAELEPALVPQGASLLPSSFEPTAAPGIPAGQNLTDLPFAFLSDIRPLVGSLPAPAAMSSDWSPGSTGIADGMNVTGFSKAAEDLAQASVPQVPGAVMHPSMQKGATAYSFNQVRQMPSIDVIPVLEPISLQQPGEFSNLNLSAGQNFDIETIRRDFPILNEKINGHSLVWLDNAATTQKPRAVIDRLNYFYSHENSNIHRAAHELAARATDAYEAARETVRRFLNAPSAREIIFVRGATEGINLVAQSWGRQNVQKDDEIVITWLEHHANIVPWQMLCAEKERDCAWRRSTITDKFSWTNMKGCSDLALNSFRSLRSPMHWAPLLR